MSTPVDEIRSLTDALFDGTIDPVQTARLEGLILNEPACLQAYLEMINLHSALLTKADSQTDEQAALCVLREFSEACERRERRTHRQWVAVSAVSILLLCGTVGSLIVGELFRPAPLGTVSHLTSNTDSSSGSMDLGAVLRRGKTISVPTGIVTLELSNVLLDLIGPAELKLEEQNQVRLQHGALTARIFPGGEGFTVRTPDAEVVDLGTEFSVQYDLTSGTDVSVRRGRARASLLDHTGTPSKVVELTTRRAARLQRAGHSLTETTYRPDAFDQVQRARAGIHSISGHLRTQSEHLPSLESEQAQTPNHLLVVPEQQFVTLQKELTIQTLTGTQTIPAGTTVSSYLVHYDPTVTSRFAPRGAMTFFGSIAAVLIDSAALNETDPLFATEGTKFSHHAHRGLERDFDEIRLSDDQKTVSFFFGMAPPVYLDQVRILVLDQN